MQPKEIKQALEEKGFNIKVIASVLDKSALSVGNVINRRTTSRPIALAICKAIEKDVTTVFPDVPSYHLSKQERLAEKQEKLRQVLNA